jgi:hypothetical protein
VPSIYYKAATYPTQQEAGKAYDALCMILEAHTAIDISAYRYLHVRRTKWCVVVIGKRPSERFDRQFTEILSRGETIELEESEIVKLVARRTEQIKQGPFVKRHHRKGKLL